VTQLTHRQQSIEQAPMLWAGKWEDSTPHQNVVVLG